MKYTYADLISIMQERGNIYAEVDIGDALDLIESLTGIRPSLQDEAPEWLRKYTIG